MKQIQKDIKDADICVYLHMTRGKILAGAIQKRDKYYKLIDEKGYLLNLSTKDSKIIRSDIKNLVTEDMKFETPVPFKNNKIVEFDFLAKDGKWCDICKYNITDKETELFGANEFKPDVYNIKRNCIKEINVTFIDKNEPNEISKENDKDLTNEQESTGTFDRVNPDAVGKYSRGSIPYVNIEDTAKQDISDRLTKCLNRLDKKPTDIDKELGLEGAHTGNVHKGQSGLIDVRLVHWIISEENKSRLNKINEIVEEIK